MGNKYDQPVHDWKVALSIPDVSKCGEAQHILVGDYFNKKINPRHMTVDHQAKSLQYFHSYAAKNRISTIPLDDTKPRGDIADLPVSTFFPTLADCAALRSNFTILMSRIIMKHLPSLLSKRWYQSILNINTLKKWRRYLMWYMFCS